MEHTSLVRKLFGGNKITEAVPLLRKGKHRNLVVRRLLGRGAYGAVFAVSRKGASSGRELKAIKVIPVCPNHRRRSECVVGRLRSVREDKLRYEVRMFRTVDRALRKFRRTMPRTPTLIDEGRIVVDGHDRHIILMSFAEGLPLRLCSEDGIEEAGRRIAAMHSKFTHGDLHAGNVLCNTRANGTFGITVIDFARSVQLSKLDEVISKAHRSFFAMMPRGISAALRTRLAEAFLQIFDIVTMLRSLRTAARRNAFMSGYMQRTAHPLDFRDHVQAFFSNKDKGEELKRWVFEQVLPVLHRQTSSR